MRNRFDQLGKELALRTLGPLGRADAQLALNAETLFADVRYEPAPGSETERRRLGLLGTLTSGPCLLELYSEPPSVDDVRTCLTKHLIYGQQRSRDARVEGNHGNRAATEHCTWMLSAGVPRRLLSELTLESADDGPGIYRLAGDFRRLGVSIGVVVASQIPLDRSTLLVRIMTGGALLAPAVRELTALPEDAFERILADPILLSFHHALEIDTTRPHDPQEQEFMMAMYRSWAEVRNEAKVEGREEGREAGRADALRRQLGLKFGEIAPTLEQRIASASHEDIDRYLERVLFATSIDEVFA